MNPEMTETALSDDEEEDHALSDEAASIQEDVTEQLEAETEAEQIDQAVQSQSSGNQRPSTIALSDELPVHTFPTQTSVSQRRGRRRKKKQDPAYCYEVIFIVLVLIQTQCFLPNFQPLFFAAGGVLKKYLFSSPTWESLPWEIFWKG